jgi:hypothetical protein
MDSLNSGDVLGVGLGRVALAICLVLVCALLVPAGLTWMGFGAISGAIESVLAPAAATTRNTSAAPRDHQGPSDSVPQPPAMDSGLQTPASTLRGLIVGWADRGPLNQYARSNYNSESTWLAWRNADCSAAALDWLLGAYGQRLASLDDAIALVGPGTGISTSVGLLDARGTPLARALATRGLTPREPRTSGGQLRPLSSTAELEAWLDRGPLLMDGARWFGEGHWFVGIGYDAGGISIRDSSGWDTRYLSWSRLYGDVGFSGWVVGVTT